MPYSLVLNLLPRSPIPTSNLSGHHLHALFLELVRSVDPELSIYLHQQTAEKAFTLSPLQVDRDRKPENKALLQWEYERAIATGTPCWWRISLLDEALFGKLAYLWLDLNSNQHWQLGSTKLDVTSILCNPQPDQPWANYVTYAQIYEQARDGSSESQPNDSRKLHFQFYTPTTFRQSKYDCALPTRDSVFKSLLKRWNHYSHIPFPETILESIYPSFFDIRTEMVSDRRSKFIGCVGSLTFQILGEVDPLTIKQINTLADFAFYAGVGRKTPMGMGMIKRL
ncbi:CRISPR-associated protein Cas6 C-terminal domain-containing protein [Tumidithrix helvetica PCC 7403]|uniref:CRISPR-associated endoribonuclease Cas6 n=1 Tax=Tumidithrix helvetica TaxID=3457545 RepID=UPI003CACED10